MLHADTCVPASLPSATLLFVFVIAAFGNIVIVIIIYLFIYLIYKFIHFIIVIILITTIILSNVLVAVKH